MKSKRILSMVLALLMMMSVAFATVAPASAATDTVASTGVYTGTGTESDPYVVSNSTDLYGLVHSSKSMHIKLGQDITLKSTLYVKSNITIDVNGKTLTFDASDYGVNIKEGCSLKIKGSGKFVQKGTKLWAMFFVEGTLETSGSVTYECPKEGGNPICMSRYGIARIYGGNFVGDQISINGGAKVYVYGGTISTKVLITKATQLYVYGGTFEKRVYNNGYFVSYGGEFLEDVSSITTTGEAILFGGHFVKGVGKYSPIETGGSHSLGSNALCYCKKLNTVADNGVYLSNEITVFSPDFAEQTPELKPGQTELDLGTINSLEDYYVSFKAKDVPAGFVELGYTIEEKIIVKDSDGFNQGYEIKSGTKGQGVKLNLGNLTGGDYTVERTINLYNGSSLVKTNKSTIKVKVNPIDEYLFGFATMKPVVSAEDMADKNTDLPETLITTETLTFGFTPFISSKLSEKGYKVKSKMYVNYDNKGTLVTLDSGKDINLMDYVDRTGDYQVWFTVSLYNGDEYVTSKSHIYNIPIVDNNAPDYLTVIFTAESNAKAGGFLQVDVEKMAEKSDEFMEACINGGVYGQWYVNGSKIDGATESRFDIPSDYAGKSIYVEVFYGDNSIESDNLLIAEGNTDPLYFANPDWGKTEEDIIKAVEYTLNSDGTYSADVIVDVDCFDGQIYYYEVEGLGYWYYDHNNKLYSGAVGGAITKPAQEEIRFQIASDLQPGTQWRAKAYLATDVYADSEVQGYEFSWVDLTVPAIPEATDPTEPATDNLYFTNPDWGKTEEDIIKAVEYTLNEDGTYTATVIVDVDCFDGQIYYYEVEGLGYRYYDHNNKLYSGAVGGAITKPAQEEIRFQIASDLQPGTQWRAKAYLATDVYADSEVQGYEFSWVDLTVPAIPEETDATENTDPTETTQGTENTDPTETTRGTENTDPTETTHGTEKTEPTESAPTKGAVIFTDDSKAQAGCKLTVDVEAMAELDEELMEAYLNNDITFKWYYDGGTFSISADNTFECKSDMVGHKVGVRVYYGDKFVVSEDFVIEEAAASLGLLGDANEDGKVNVKDATAIQKHIANLITLTETGEKLADADENAKVNIKDATAIQKFVADLPVGNKIGEKI